MKKTTIAMMAAALAIGLTASAHAEDKALSALDAFNQLTGQAVALDAAAAKIHDDYLTEIMNGAYAVDLIDTATAQTLAPALPELSVITTEEIALYAANNNLPVAKVRNAYFRALANALRAEIMINPASEEKYQNIQVILSLFLDEDDTETVTASRKAIRETMTKETAQTIATDYQLPVSFVEFVIMDDDWDDASWGNDDAWTVNAGWGYQNTDDWSLEYGWGYEQTDDYVDTDGYYDYMDSLDLIQINNAAGATASGAVSYTGTTAVTEADIGFGIGTRDNSGSTQVAQLQQQLIDLGYLSGKADGIFGPRTEAALIEFQLANGLAATGSYGANSQQKIASPDVVARTSYVESYYKGTDGVYDTPIVTTNGNGGTTTTYRATDYYTPDYNTPDYNTPDYRTPDYNTPDYSNSYDSSYDSSYENS